MDWFLSDLHMFSRRSIYHEHEDEILSRAAEARVFVLGGDIVDFSWTTLPSVEATIDASMQWLTDLVESNRGCQFHYLLGNHDCHADFVKRLGDVAESHENFHWEPYFLRIGSAVMLHGDAVHLKNRTNLALATQRNRKHQFKQPEYRHQIYEMAIRSRLHAVVGKLANPRRVVAGRIWDYLTNEKVDMGNSVRNVYFGHTHVPMSDYAFRGIQFHNGGASISGLKFNMLPMQLDGHCHPVADNSRLA
ncbi:metallophosphoesterase [Bremerella sp. P1]|uniref:metallophosphoesterase n=1 Tax=Bremerella sp. P1 TaxID=3026424 RepID=UPI0023682EB2|nr:metallophosphoesterase [Bremerella sp. P1]WDI41909.1 metallophosphoesterase [Bremerella sp. P1]